MASPPEVLLEPGDNEAYQGMVRSLTQMKHNLSLKIGRPGASLEDMHVAKSLQTLLGDSPSQARMALVAPQGQVTREELLTHDNSLLFQSVHRLSYIMSIPVRGLGSILPPFQTWAIMVPNKRSHA